MPRTSYETAATAATTGSSFTLTPGQSRTFYSTAQLLSGEAVTLQESLGGSWHSKGAILDRDNDSAVVRNTTNRDQTYRANKSVTTQSIGLEYE